MSSAPNVTTWSLPKLLFCSTCGSSRVWITDQTLLDRVLRHAECRECGQRQTYTLEGAR